MEKNDIVNFVDKHQNDLFKVHTWLIEEKIKTKKDISKFLDKKKLQKLLDSNLKKYQSKEYKGKIKYEDFDYDNFYSLTNLKIDILSAFCHPDLDPDYVANVCSHGFISQYNGESMFDIYDILHFSSVELSQICFFSLSEKNLEDYPNLLYINLKIDSKNSYLIKMINFPNDRATIQDFVVVKKHSGKLNKALFNFILLDSLDSFTPQCYPWDHIEVCDETTKHLKDSLVCRGKKNTKKNRGYFVSDVPLFKNYLIEAKKRVKTILRKSFESGTSEMIHSLAKKDNLFETVVVFINKPLISSNNKSYWEDWPFE
tara:strand:+ start:112 stop:1053 length:942 start_codon:yes stop_codon:yes gene_type:complete